jgi:transcriptional regulator with XRE-family HTH domain
VVSEEKKQRFSELLKYIRGNDGVKKFAARLGIKLPTYSAWETARAFPSDEIWAVLLPQLCQLSGFTPELIDRYLRGDYELLDLIEGPAAEGLLPRARPIMTVPKFRAWLQTLSLTEAIQVLKDASERATELALQPPQGGKSGDTPAPHRGGASLGETAEAGEKPGEVHRHDSIGEAGAELWTFRVNPSDEEAVASIIGHLSKHLSLEKMVRVDSQLRERIFFNLQKLGLLDMKKYQNNPFYILMEEYRLANGLSYEQFEDRLLREGRDAVLDPQKIAKIVRGQSLPDARELIWIGAFIRKPDGSLYDHEELIALRDGTFSAAPEKLEDFHQNNALNFVNVGCKNHKIF